MSPSSGVNHLLIIHPICWRGESQEDSSRIDFKCCLSGRQKWCEPSEFAQCLTVYPRRSVSSDHRVKFTVCPHRTHGRYCNPLLDILPQDSDPLQREHRPTREGMTVLSSAPEFIFPKRASMTRLSDQESAQASAMSL
jgi:hypothetical protein